jgi:hypothetical protein
VNFCWLRGHETLSGFAPEPGGVRNRALTNTYGLTVRHLPPTVSASICFNILWPVSATTSEQGLAARDTRWEVMALPVSELCEDASQLAAGTPRADLFRVR